MYVERGIYTVLLTSAGNIMTKVRGFEIVSKYKDAELSLPKRATSGSAGYDLTAAVDIMVPSVLKALKETDQSDLNPMRSTLIPTGVKAFMPENEYLLLANRSSNPMKRQLAVPNGIGVIDSDYYGNEGNEGEIFVQVINYGLEDMEIVKGERIAQGIFSKYEVVDEEEQPFEKRTGGFGSSGR